MFHLQFTLSAFLKLFQSDHKDASNKVQLLKTSRSTLRVVEKVLSICRILVCFKTIESILSEVLLQGCAMPVFHQVKEAVFKCSQLSAALCLEIMFCCITIVRITKNIVCYQPVISCSWSCCSFHSWSASPMSVSQFWN